MQAIEHLVVTPPDRYFGEGIKLLWIDWNWGQIDQCLDSMRGSPIKIVTHLFGGNDTDFRWLLNVSNQADLVVINLGQSSQADPFKGSLLPMDKCFYYGRKDLADIFPGYIDDPLGVMLSLVGNVASKGKT